MIQNQNQHPQLQQLLQVRSLGSGSVQASQLLKDPIKLNKIMNIKPYVLNINLAEEADFVDDYEKKVVPQRKERDNQIQIRRERWNSNQTRIFEEQDKQRRLELHNRDIEYSKQLEENERKQLEQEQRQKNEAAEKEYKLLQVANHFPFVETEMIRSLLEQNGWNLDKVVQHLKIQFENEKREEEKRENMVFQMMSMFPNIDFEYVKNTLQRKNWNLENAINEHKSTYLININMNIIGISGMPEMIPAQFQKSDDGFQIISYLTQKRDPKDKYYKLFKNKQCTVPLSYLDLSQNFIQLKLFNNDTIYVKEDAEPPF